MLTLYTVRGMTCDHCVAAVTEEVKGIPGVTNVDLALDSGQLAVVSTEPLDTAVVAAAVAEAGDYTVTAN